MPAQASICDIPYSVAHRKVKYPRLEFKTGTLLVVLPNGQDEKRILKKNRQWIEQKYRFIQDAVIASDNIIPESRSWEELKILILESIGQYSQDLGCTPNRVFMRKMVTKWASCSKKGNITVNSLLRYLPKNLIEYVIFHEMAHLICKKHDELFWKCINEKFQNPQEIEKDLCNFWFLVQKLQ
jgi:predicted metal-dependent hydrolase